MVPIIILLLICQSVYGKYVTSKTQNITSRRDINHGDIARSALKNKAFQQHIENIFNKTKDEILAQNQTYLNGSHGPAGTPRPKISNGAQGENGLQSEMGLKGPKGIGIITPSLNATRNVTTDVLFSCSFFGNPKPSIQWKHNGQKVNGKNVVMPFTALVKSTFVLKNITWKDKGNITCEVKSVLGEASSTGFINVYIPPRLNCTRKVLHAYIGSNYTFPKCHITSNPEPVIKWSRGFLPMPETKFIRSGQSLEIKDFQIQDEGFYMMEVSNPLGRKRVILQLRSKRLNFEVKPISIIETHQSANLTCVANGDHKRITGKWIYFKSRREIPFTKQSSENHVTLTTTVEPGTYECQFNDGTDHISAVTTVVKTPKLLSRGKNVSLSSVDNNGVGNHCTDGDLSTFAETKYDEKPWLMIDLGQNAKIDHIQLTKYHVDKSTDLASIIAVSNKDDFSQEKICARYNANSDGSVFATIKLNCQNFVVGRYVMLYIIGRRDKPYIKIHEMEVFGNFI